MQNNLTVMNRSIYLNCNETCANSSLTSTYLSINQRLLSSFLKTELSNKLYYREDDQPILDQLLLNRFEEVKKFYGWEYTYELGLNLTILADDFLQLSDGTLSLGKGDSLMLTMSLFALDFGSDPKVAFEFEMFVSADVKVGVNGTEAKMNVDKLAPAKVRII